MKQLFIVTFFDGEKDNWDVTIAENPTEAEERMEQKYKDDYEIDIEDAEAYQLDDVEGYKITVSK